MPDAPWVYDETFGILHQDGCRICRNYMVHASDAILDESSYSAALQDRNDDLQRRFQDGFRRGRSLQHQHDLERLKAYKAQRDEGRALMEEYKLRCEEAEAAVLQLRDELLALRIAYDDLIPETVIHRDDFDIVDIPSSGGDSEDDQLTESDFDSEASLSSEEDVLESDEDEDESSDNDIDDGSPSIPSDGEKPEPGPQPSDDAIIISEHPSTDLLSSTDDEGPIIRVSTLSFFAVEANDHYETDVEDVDARASASLPPNTCPSLLPSKPSRPTSSSKSSSNRLAVIREQMQLARQPDNREILKRVKSLVSKAHKTPPERRTEVQKALLVEWRRPPRYPPLNLDISTCSEPVYVDASGVGIGFTFQGRWQAWEFMIDWEEEGLNIQWAEAVAVELGIRLMIQAGYTDRRLTIRSDNEQVVNAVKGKHPFAHSQAGKTVQRVNRLCEKHCIKHEILWIPGWANPADGPSRLHVESEAQRFPHEIDIPTHLQNLLQPYKPKIPS